MSAFMLHSVLAAALLAFPALAIATRQRRSLSPAERAPSFEQFLATNTREYGNNVGATEYELRRFVYEKRAAAVNAHNAASQRRFTATVGEHADFNHTEMSALHGLATASESDTGELYRNLVSGGDGHPKMSLEAVKTQEETLPDGVNWGHLKTMMAVKSQGHCGSCWAASSLKAIEAGLEINQRRAVNMSIQHLVSCAPNPLHCGGKGGCHGATSTIAMDFVLHHGVVDSDEYPYLAEDAECPARLMQKTGQSNSNALGNNIGMRAWYRLQPNMMEPIMRAVAEIGPMVASLAASDGLDGLGIHGYAGGVFDACSKDTIVNHAMVLFGYGKQGDNAYWLLQNSWGPRWGEGGRMKMLRVDGHCGIDDKPQKGSGCDGGASQISVCGMCGISYRAVVPIFGQQDSAGSKGGRAFLPTSDLAATSENSPASVD